MLCQHCGQNEATRHYTTTMGGETRQTHLCAACAAGTGFDAEFQKTFPAFTFNIPALMTDMMGLRALRPGGVCPACGLRLEELTRSGQVGCAGCYDAFKPSLDPYIRRVHGDVRHTGRIPAGVAPEMERRRKLEALECEMKESIQTQAFERAAELRDQIARLKEDGERA